jgi:zinc protease
VPRQEYTVSIGFGSNPERTDALVQRVLEEIATFRTTGPTQKEVDDTREALKREFEGGTTQNGYLLTQIAGRYQSGESVEDFFRITETYDALTTGAIQDAARAYLNLDRYVKVTLAPER